MLRKLEAIYHIILGHPICYEMRIAGSPNFLNGYLISGKFGDFPEEETTTNIDTGDCTYTVK